MAHRMIPGGLEDFFREHPRVVLAFSGGVDSSYLLYAAGACGADVRPYFINTAFQPAFEAEDARRLCLELGRELTVLDMDILAEDAVRANPYDRCYYCKSTLFNRLVQETRGLGADYVVIEGTNASDDEDDRPGMRAIRELNVLSPLRLSGLTKDRIRELSRDAGLFTWSKPSYACLATRIMTGVEINREELARAEDAEERLKALGFYDLRVRIFHDCARIQLPDQLIPMAAARYRDIYKALSPLFEAVLLDLKNR